MKSTKAETHISNYYKIQKLDKIAPLLSISNYPHKKKLMFKSLILSNIIFRIPKILKINYIQTPLLKIKISLKLIQQIAILGAHKRILYFALLKICKI